MPHEHHDHPHSLLPPEPELRVKALETILVEKGLVDPEALQLIIDTYQHKIGPQIGARLVARAWADARFKDRLLNDTDTVLAEAELAGRQGEHVVVVENTIHITLWSALCAAAILGRFWAFRQAGINQIITVGGQCASRGQYWLSLA